MVNAGLVPITVVDDYLAQFWKQVFTSIEPHPSAAVRTGGVLAVAIRKNNPKLKNATNLWLKRYGESTAFANVLQKRYLEMTSTSGTPRRRRSVASSRRWSSTSARTGCITM